MRKVRVVRWGLVGLVLAASASAAEIHGTVSEGGKPLAAVVVKLDCGGTSVSGKTDEFGSYSLKLGATGDCRLTLEYKGATPSLKVTVYDKPSRYDLVVSDEGGKPTVRRK
jgi:hypothetical protein